MSGPRFDQRIHAVEFTAGDDADALGALATWLRANDHRLDVAVITITHDYGDQYTPSMLTAYVMVDE